MKKSDVEKLIKEYLQTAAEDSFNKAHEEQKDPTVIYPYAFGSLKAKIEIFIEEFEKLE
ncbi:MAG: hypothetical protein JXR78_09160 [Victivallales bacterium]|nr:hypothetical protein [Victivallales bacterium]